MRLCATILIIQLAAAPVLATLPELPDGAGPAVVLPPPPRINPGECSPESLAKVNNYADAVLDTATRSIDAYERAQAVNLRLVDRFSELEEGQRSAMLWFIVGLVSGAGAAYALTR